MSVDYDPGMPKPGQRDLLLDAWRGVSVLLVISSHAAARIAGFDSRAFVDLAAPLGTLGVQFFFAISGYIITLLLIREAEANGAVSLKAFYIRRCCRILPPLALLFIGLCVLQLAGVIQVSSREFAMSSLFLCNTTHCGWFLGHTWSLAVEEQFYIVWPSLLALAGIRFAPALAICAVLVFLALAQAGLLFSDGINNGLHFACIAAGALYAASERMRQLVQAAAHPPALLAAALLLLGRPGIPLVFPGQYRMLDVLTPMLIVLCLFGSFRHREVIESWRPTRILAGVGAVSYGLYLWQQIFLAPPSFYSAIDLGHFWVLLPVVVYLSWRYIEQPFIRWGARISRRLRGPAGVEPPIPKRPASAR